MRYSLISQAVLIVVSLIIIFSFIKPTLAEIGKTQDQVKQYKDAVSKASELNSRLQELVTTKNSFSSDQLARLEKFIPNTIDTLQIMKDIEGIAVASNVKLEILTAKDLVSPVSNVTVNGGSKMKKDIPPESYQDFTLSFTGTYSDLKRILQLAESNETLLEVTDLNFDTVSQKSGQTSAANTDQVPSGQHTFTMTFRTYALSKSSNTAQ